MVVVVVVVVVVATVVKPRERGKFELVSMATIVAVSTL
jgi:hypothetical protein